ncbi:hypothetical protein [uncultured Psychrobacter sp.]|uniref:hypothetical protein n=1 Tax=uncultured Psychrobacter sp. TaxID=259303 RepID=UPI003457D2A0
MYNSNISINADGYLVATTEYKGLVAFYLKRNNVYVEKKWYELNNKYVFKEKFSSGVFGVKFFFKNDEGIITTYETKLYLYNPEDISLKAIGDTVLEKGSTIYNSNISLNADGYLVATTEYKGLVAFYLKRNNSNVEKKWYGLNNQYVFKEKFKNGVFSVKFFFKDNNGRVSTYETDMYLYNSKDMSLERMKAVTLKEGKDYKISYYNRESNITFITFNGTNTTKNTMPFALSLAMSNGWNLVSVAQDNDTQYQGLSLDDFYEAVSQVIVNKEVYAYGASLGGYCALYFGGCINATIIAASPKNSAHSSIRMAKFKGLTFNHDCFSTIPITSKKVYIVYDPTIKSDSTFITKYISLAYPSPNVLTIEHGTHMVLQTMLKAGVLKLYVKSIVNNTYGTDVSKYIVAKCRHSQGKDEEVLNILQESISSQLKTYS